MYKKFDGKISKIQCGKFFTSILLKTGYLYTTGSNENGALGHGDFKDRFEFTKVNAFKRLKIIDFSSGQYHIVFLNDVGFASSCGNGYYGQTGIGFNDEINTPVLMKGTQFIKKVFCTQVASFLLTIQGRVFVCGENAYGVLGILDKGNINVPRIIPPEYFDNEEIINIVACESGFHVFFQGKSNRYWCCGVNCFGSLGQSKADYIYRPILFTFMKGKIKMISTCDHTLVLLNNGDVYSVGRNKFGKLGIGKTFMELISTPEFNKIPHLSNKKVIKVIATFSNSFFCTQYGDLYVCGRNVHNIVSRLSNESILFPIKSEIRNIKSVSCGWDHCVYLTKRNELIMAGKNNVGQLGMGKKVDGFNPFVYMKDLGSLCEFKNMLRKLILQFSDCSYRDLIITCINQYN